MNTLASLKQASVIASGQTASRKAPPPTSLMGRAIPVLIFLFCLAYLCIPLRYSSLEPDEGIVLQGAERILHGQLPYRDFFTFYTPGSFYFLALMFRLFGDSFVVARFSLAVVGAACSVLTYLIARRVCGRGISLLMAVLATMLGTGFRFLILHNWYSTLLCCLALYAALRFLESAKPAWALVSALCASLTFLFEQSKGAGLCLGLAFAFLIFETRGKAKSLTKPALIASSLGFSLPVLLTFAYFAAHHAAIAMVQSWLWPLQHYARANHVPYGYQNWSEASRHAIFRSGPAWIRAVKVLTISPDFVIPLLPLIALGLLAYFVVKPRRDEELPGNADYYILISSTVLGLLISVVISRADILHFIYLAPILYLVLAWILDGSGFKSRLLLAARPYLVIYVAIAFGLLGLAVLLHATGAAHRIETRRGPITTSGEDTVIEYVQARVPAGSNFLVYPYLPLYNYLTETRPLSPYDYFQPGMNTREQASELVTSLQTQPSMAVLFEPGFAEKIANSWPGTPTASITDDLAADYIVHNYRVCQILTSPEGWRFHYMVRKQQSCP